MARDSDPSHEVMSSLYLIYHNDVDDVSEDDLDSHTSRPAEENEFEFIVRQMEEVILSEEFQAVQNGFCDKHCGLNNCQHLQTFIISSSQYFIFRKV